jgi:hypothetical protein
MRVDEIAKPADWLAKRLQEATRNHVPVTAPTFSTSWRPEDAYRPRPWTNCVIWEVTRFPH